MHIFLLQDKQVATLSFAQDELIKISKVSTPIWKKQDKFDKFIDKVINQAVTNFSIRFMDGLKAY
jgi:protease-4